MTPADVERRVAPHGLFVMGALHPEDDTTRTIVLIGAQSDFWPVFVESREFGDGAPDPLDRWSKRVIGKIAGTCPTLFPSDGPPYAPFIQHALATGRFFQSPTGMMVHDVAGLMISIRGAIVLDGLFPLPEPQQSPCETCATRPCISACPVDALSVEHAYDVPTCKKYLASADGQRTCMSLGCAVRVACPISRKFGRDPVQSAFHMRAFTGATS